MITIQKFDPGGFNRNPARDCKTWEAAKSIIQQLLSDAGLPRGPYNVRVHRKVHWNGDHPTIPYRVGRFEHNKIYITVKHPDAKHDDVFEYGVAGSYTRWDARLGYFAVRDYIDARTLEVTELASVKTKSNGQDKPAEEPRLSILEKLAKLEEVARRNDDREKKLDDAAELVAVLKEKAANIQEQLAKLETQQLQLMEEIDNDAECKSAKESLAALENLLG